MQLTPPFSHKPALRESIATQLQVFERQETSSNNYTAAAVALTVIANHPANEAAILLTRRSSNLRKHAGQYALPGGKVDSGETTTEAARRELAEELNLQSTPANVLGMLDDMVTQSGFCITPVIIWLENQQTIKPNPDEVAAVFKIPFTELDNVNMDLSADDTPENAKVMSLYLPSVGTSVYSPTAAMIYQFREVVLHGKHTRVSQLGQPRFAWR